jgi:O-antigen/teichoic acid export membrane protein
MWALVASLGINLVLNNKALRAQELRFGIKERTKSCMGELSVLWRYSLPAVLAGAMVAPVDWICCAFLANRPGGYNELGLFSAASQWFALLLFVPGTLSQVLLPLVATQLGQNNYSNSIKLLKYGIATNLVMVVPVAIVACVLSPIIMGLYGPSFQEGWPTLVVVLLTAVLLAGQTPVGQMIAASGNLWVGFAMNLGWAIVFITATYLLVNRGAIGLSTARASAYLVHATWTSAYTVSLLRSSRRNFDPTESTIH